MRVRRSPLLLLGILACLLAAQTQAAPLILNEYNAVNASNYLNGGTLGVDEDGGAAADPAFGRVLGNGGDWFELVVIAEGLDIRGWQLEVWEDDPNGIPVLDATIVFADDPLWTGLEAGTIITIGEDVANDVSYAPIEDPTDPGAGDWWIHVQANGTTPASPAYVTQTDFKVNNDDWQLVIKDDLGQTVFGPAGEGIVPAVSVNTRETFRLEAAPSALVEPDDTAYDDGGTSSFGAPNSFGSGTQDFSALRLNLPVPDRDGDGVPDDGDLSGVAGDLPCATGASGCDDNCPIVVNPGQEDTDGVNGSGPDGKGSHCQCGDVDDSGGVDVGDWDELRQWLAGLIADVTAPEKCGVIHDGACTLADAAATYRAISGEPAPGLADVCSAAAIPDDLTDLLFDPDRVLDISITMAPADWEALRFEGRDVYETLGPGCFDGPQVSPYTFFPADIAIDGITLTNVGVRKKGFFGSASYVKPSLKVDFTEFEGAGQTFLGMDRLTLNNDKQDPSHVKQCIGYALFAAAGLPASRCNFARVSVNGQDLGLFSNVESIKRPFLERNFGNDDGNLYEGMVSDFRPTWQNTFQKKTNESDPSRADIQTIVDALTVPDVDLESTLDPLVDLDEFYAFWAMEMIVEHWDSYHDNRNNFWIYFNPANGGRLEFIPWGIDALFAGGSPLAGEGGAPLSAVKPRSMLTRRLYLNPATQGDYLAKVNELLNTVFDEAALLLELDRMQALLEPFEPGIGTRIDAVRAKISSRRAEIEAELAGGPPPWTEPLPDATCLADVGGFNATFNTTWDSVGDPANGTGSLSLTFDPDPPEVFSIYSAEAGPDAAGVDVVQVVGYQGLFQNFRILYFPVQRELVAPGTVDLGPFLLFVLSLDTGTGAITPVGLAINATITFDPGTDSSTPGAPVSGSISGDLGGWTLGP